MKKYKIPIVWQLIKFYDVEANNLEEAVKIALKEFFDTPCTDGHYLEDSMEIDGIIEDNHPDEKYDLNKILNEIL